MNIPILSDILDGIVKAFTWLKNTVSWGWAAVVAFILTPVNYIIGVIQSFMDALLAGWDSLDRALEQTGAFDVSSYWAGAMPYLDRANAIFPINFSISLVMGLITLWVICQVIRFGLRFVPLGSG